MLGRIWIQTVWHTDSIPERIFWKSLKKKSKKTAEDDKKGRKITQHACQYT